MQDAVESLLSSYPKIYFACHTRHVIDQASGNVLTAKQAGILDHVDPVEPLSVSTLASHLGITPATMCAAIDRLESMGYLVRERSEEDRRVVNVRLTEMGLRVREKNSVLDPERVAGLFELMTDKDRKHAVAGLELLAKAAQEYLRIHGTGWRLRDETK